MDDNYFFAVPVVVFEVIYGVAFNSTHIVNWRGITDYSDEIPVK